MSFSKLRLYRLPSPGMLRYVIWLKFSDVSEKHVASLFKVDDGNLGKYLPDYTAS
jgi:hypothetical protein